MSKDSWENSNYLDSPAYDGFSITPSDTEFTISARALYIGGDGNVTLVTPGGTELTFTGLLAGTILPVRCNVVKASSTATLVIGLY